MVSESPSGLTGKQIGDVLGLSPRSFLHHFRDAPGLCRRKYGGVYVYFSDNPGSYTTQEQNRVQIERLAEPDLCDTDAVMILVAMLKQHGGTIEAIMAMPEIRARKFSAGVIREFLNRHGLLKKL